jgi:hypothetical protein
MKELFYLGIVAVFLNSCTKEGLGGDATLVVKPAHHGLPIVSTTAYQDSVFIKYNTLDAPANPTSEYDLLIVGTVGEDHIHVEGLKHGDYYVYCTGWDTSINMRVSGGIPVTIKRKERKDEIVTDVPVVE